MEMFSNYICDILHLAVYVTWRPGTGGIPMFAPQKKRRVTRIDIVVIGWCVPAQQVCGIERKVNAGLQK